MIASLSNRPISHAQLICSLQITQGILSSHQIAMALSSTTLENTVHISRYLLNSLSRILFLPMFFCVEEKYKSLV